MQTRPRSTVVLRERPPPPPPLGQRRMSQALAQRQRTQADAAPAGAQAAADEVAPDPAAVALAQAREFAARLEVLGAVPFGPDGRLKNPDHFVELATAAASCRVTSSKAAADLEKALLPLVVPTNLKRASTPQLQALEAALTKWVVEREHIRQELLRRENTDIRQEDAPTPAEVLAALQSIADAGPLASAMHTLKQTTVMVGRARTPQQRESTKQAFLRQVRAGIGKWQAAQRAALASAMSDPPFGELRDALAVLPSSVMLVEYPALLEELRFHASVLDTAAQACGLPPRKAVLKLVLSELGETAKIALKELGIEVRASGTLRVRPGFATTGVHGAVQKGLRAACGPVPATSDTVHEAMWLEFATCNFFIENPRPEPGARAQWIRLVEREDWNLLTQDEKSLRRAAAVNSLRELLGPKVLHAVSCVANSRLMRTPEFLEAIAALTPADILPRGMRAHLAGTHTYTFRIRCDGTGGAVVHCEFAIRDATHVFSMDKTVSSLSVPLVRQNSFLRVMYDVPVTAQAHILYDGTPVMYEAGAQPDAWSIALGARNPKPQVVDQLFELRDNDEMFKAFEASLEKDHCQENLHFVRAVDALRANPKEAGAQEIARTFILPGSPSEVNLKSSTSSAIQRLLNEPRLAGGAKLPELLRLFVVARTEIVEMTTRDKLPMFLRQFEADLHARRLAAAQRAQGGTEPTAQAHAAAQAGQEQHDPHWADGHTLVGIRLKKLALPFATADKIRTSIGPLKSAVPREIKDATERRDRLLTHVAVLAEEMDATALAAIQVNLSALAKSEIDVECHLSEIEQIVAHAYRRKREADVDLKSLLLSQLHRAQDTTTMMNMLALWLEQGHVDPAGMQKALAHLSERDPQKLSTIAHSAVQLHERIARIAKVVLASRHIRLADEVQTDAEALAAPLVNAQRLSREDGQALVEQVLVQVAAVSVKYKNLQLLQQLGAGPTATGERAKKHLAELADLLQQAAHAGLLPPGASEPPVSVTLESLGVVLPPPPPREKQAAMAVHPTVASWPPMDNDDEPLPPPPDDADFPSEARWKD